MFTPPNILLIQKFDFEKEDAEPKDKFLIVLFQVGEDAIIAPLTTSQDYLPDYYKNKRCVKDDPSCIHCYYIPKALVIGRNGFAFIKDTYIHINPANLKRRSVLDLKKRYEATGMASLKDALTDAEYCDFLYCVYKSKHVPRGIRSAMEPIIGQLELKKASQS